MIIRTKFELNFFGPWWNIFCVFLLCRGNFLNFTVHHIEYWKTIVPLKIPQCYICYVFLQWNKTVHFPPNMYLSAINMYFFKKRRGFFLVNVHSIWYSLWSRKMQYYFTSNLSSCLNCTELSVEFTFSCLHWYFYMHNLTHCLNMSFEIYIFFEKSVFLLPHIFIWK